MVWKCLHNVLWVVLLCCETVFGQGNYKLEVHCTDGNLPDVEIEETFADVKARQSEINLLLSTLNGDGFLAASLDSTTTEKNLLHAYVHLGQRFEWAALRPGNVDEEILSETGFRTRLFDGRPFRPEQYRRMLERILRHCENNGFPFASIVLDSATITENTISGSLRLEKRELTVIDSIVIKGEANVAPVYVYNYLGIQPGDPYNEELVRRASIRVREIPFLKETKPAEVLFLPGKAQVFLYLETVPASQFNGVLGVQPDNVTGQITITGDAKLKLKNAIGRGELIDLNWRKLRTLTQDLNVHLNYPFLFNTPIGADFRLQLYKRDTTFLEVDRTIGLQYLLRGGDFIQVSVGRKSSNLIEESTILNATTLPAFADVSVTRYGLALQKQNLDYRLNPRSGIRLNVAGAVGVKNISKNDSLEELNPGIYDDVTLRSTQYDLKGNIDLFVPVMKRATIRIGGKGGYLLNDNMFQNEFYRLGGINDLRGFDAESIFASAFAIGTIEYRFLLERNSNIYAFFDGAWYEQRQTESYVRDTPYGFGLGISFETGAGIFSLNYALGKQFDNPILFRAAKVHFGFTNFF